ncbi:MAG: hypothetical protein K5681_08520 [Treponema sp.]|nr:hypothetical protein [Treponema sp.]
MKFIDLIYIMLLLSMISAAVLRFSKSFIELDKRESELSYQKDSISFISQSFINTCDGMGFPSLNEWQKSCKAMWTLDYIAWADAASFLPVKSGVLLYGSWKNNDLSGEVYCRPGAYPEESYGLEK